MRCTTPSNVRGCEVSSSSSASSHRPSWWQYPAASPSSTPASTSKRPFLARAAPSRAQVDHLPGASDLSELAPQVEVDPDGVGDVAGILGDPQRTLEFGQPARSVAHRRDGDAECVAGMSLVGRRSCRRGGRDRLARQRQGVLESIGALVGVGAPCQDPGPRHRWGRRRHEVDARAGRRRARRRRDRPAAGTTRAVSWRSPARAGSTDSSRPRQRLTDELRSPIELADPAGSVGSRCRSSSRSSGSWSGSMACGTVVSHASIAHS